jgi:hypothetical protein
MADGGDGQLKIAYGKAYIYGLLRSFCVPNTIRLEALRC